MTEIPVPDFSDDERQLVADLLQRYKNSTYTRFDFSSLKTQKIGYN